MKADKSSFTDVLLDAENAPFITLVESHIPNVWFRENDENLYCLTEGGFKRLGYTKKDFIKARYHNR